MHSAGKLTAAAAALLLAGMAPAAAAPKLVQCTFGAGQQASDLTLVIPDGIRKARSKTVEISALPGRGEERPAIARQVSKADSEIGRKYAQILFSLDAQTGFVVQVADNGDGLAYPIDHTEAATGTMHLGYCDTPGTIFNLWY